MTANQVSELLKTCLANLYESKLVPTWQPCDSYLKFLCHMSKILPELCYIQELDCMHSWSKRMSK